jgi:hypothetical protein
MRHTTVGALLKCSIWSCLVLYCLALPCLALPCLALPCPVLSLPCLVKCSMRTLRPHDKSNDGLCLSVCLPPYPFLSHVVDTIRYDKLRTCVPRFCPALTDSVLASSDPGDASPGLVGISRTKETSVALRGTNDFASLRLVPG